MARRPMRNTAETTAWWAALLILWLLFISTIDALEVLVGAAVSLVGAVAAGAARRAVTDR
ncbi:hypothetical protein C3486_35655 [Streptomyces sp. Ru73]|uniref:hypothetical protein n=1 Tax=Streptomyces sp. Ru73 TaxID=2080748 RepID=UPI000CDE343B|nr:hypothetical protein [Streptomyces sp. Ru73]POX36049.1 hypothetical protein C3486_35655 [Streptomyces sp. Ru73]